MTTVSQTNLSVQTSCDQLPMQENAFTHSLAFTGVMDADPTMPLVKRFEPDLNWSIKGDWSAPIRALIESNPNTATNILLTLDQISRKEYFFLEDVFLAMIVTVHELRVEMKEICSSTGSRIKVLKRELQMLKETLFKMLNDNTQGINIKEVQTSNKILALEYELNSLQKNRKYNELSEIKASAKKFPTDKLEDSELSNLTRLGILQVARSPYNLVSVATNSDENIFLTTKLTAVSVKNYYCFSEFGLNFIQACTGKIL